MADYLVAAIGFDVWSRLALVEHPAVDALRVPGGAGRREQVEREMSPDLSLPTGLGLPAGLHFPSLAGLAHGPGMSNLGCLGLMAAAVLDPYLG